jgi:hypothetical protein
MSVPGVGGTTKQLSIPVLVLLYQYSSTVPWLPVPPVRICYLFFTTIDNSLFHVVPRGGVVSIE